LWKDTLRVSREEQEAGVIELVRTTILSDDSPGLIEKIGIGPMIGGRFEKGLGECLHDASIQI
jgi:hypothetical protein